MDGVNSMEENRTMISVIENDAGIHVRVDNANSAVHVVGLLEMAKAIIIKNDTDEIEATQQLLESAEPTQEA